MVDASSHSAYASDAALASGFSLYARPMRIANQNTRCSRDAQERTTSKKVVVEKVARLNFVIRDARGFAFVVGGVNLEIGEERARFFLQETQHRHSHATDFELGALAAAQLEHRAPRACVPRDDDLHFGCVR